MKLSEMKAGQSGTINLILGNNKIVQRLQEMGLIQGSSIKVAGFAPLGDPMSIKIHGSKLALRKSEASLIDIDQI